MPSVPFQSTLRPCLWDPTVDTLLAPWDEVSFFDDIEVWETEDFEESDNADIGGECGGKGMVAGSILGTNGGFFGVGTSWVDTKVWWL